MSASSVGSITVAQRYALALFEVALDKKIDLRKIAGELAEFDALLKEQTALEQVLSSPAIPTDKRVAVLERVLSTTAFDRATVNVLRLLTEKERMSLLSMVSAQFERLVNEHEKIEIGSVVSAHVLTEKQRERLAQRLGEAAGKTMELSYSTDPTSLGGLIVRIDNRVYDASVVKQLERFIGGAAFFIF